MQILQYFIKNQSPENCNSVLLGYAGFLLSKCNLATIMKKFVVPSITYIFFSTPKTKFINYFTNYLCVTSKTVYLMKNVKYMNIMFCFLLILCSVTEKNGGLDSMYVCIHQNHSSPCDKCTSQSNFFFPILNTKN